MALPPPLPLPLPFPPLAVPVPQRSRAATKETIGDLRVEKIGYNAMEMQVGPLRKTLTRTEVTRLIGMLERIGATL